MPGRVNDFDRPRFSPAIDPVAKLGFEYAALRRVHDHLSTVGDPRFASIRPLDHFESESTIVIEHFPARTLRQLLLATSLRSRTAPNLDVTLDRVGAWLRELHALAGDASTSASQQVRKEALAELDSFVDFLDGRAPDRTLAAIRNASETISEALTAPVPIAPGHGDFAPRNVFVTPAGQVCVFDIMGHEQPIFEDLACFFVDLRTSGLQLLPRPLSHSEEQIDALERSLLRGYFTADGVPHSTVAAYSLLGVLDRWVSLVHREGTFQSMRQRMLDGRAPHPFSAEIYRLLGLLELRPHDG